MHSISLVVVYVKMEPFAALENTIGIIQEYHESISSIFVNVGVRHAV
jgi:hypothetical protein